VTYKYSNQAIKTNISHMHNPELTCLINVIGFCPIAWQSPILALITSVKGFLAP